MEGLTWPLPETLTWRMTKDVGKSRDLKLGKEMGSKTDGGISLKMVSIRKQGKGAGPTKPRGEQEKGWKHSL